MATKKKGLGRGLDGMIQQPTAAVIPVQTLAGQQEQEVRTPPPVHPAVSNAALLIADATRGMGKDDAETMLHMIVRLCQFHLENGYLA